MSLHNFQSFARSQREEWSQVLLHVSLAFNANLGTPELSRCSLRSFLWTVFVCTERLLLESINKEREGADFGEMSIALFPAVNVGAWQCDRS